jgi:hypothetical protein
MIAGYMGASETFDDAIGEFAMEYADQNERDYRRFLTAVKERPYRSDPRRLDQLILRFMREPMPDLKNDKNEADGKLKRKEYERELARLHVEFVKLQQWVVH